MHTISSLLPGFCSPVMGDCKAHWYQIYFLIPKFLDSPGPVNMRNVTENCHQKSSKLCDHLKFEWSLNFSTWTLEKKAHIDIFCSVTFFFYPYFSFLQQVFYLDTTSVWLGLLTSRNVESVVYTQCSHQDPTPGDLQGQSQKGWVRLTAVLEAPHLPG